MIYYIEKSSTFVGVTILSKYAVFSNTYLLVWEGEIDFSFADNKSGQIYFEWFPELIKVCFLIQVIFTCPEKQIFRMFWFYFFLLWEFRDHRDFHHYLPRCFRISFRYFQNLIQLREYLQLRYHFLEKFFAKYALLWQKIKF